MTPPFDASPGTAIDGIAPARRPPRAVTVALATAGLLAVTAASAAVTVAVGRPAQRPAAALAAPSASAPATVATPPPSASATPSAPRSAPASPTAAPTPRSTVTGRVAGDAHLGDLRFFLLPLPRGAEVYGNPDGTALTLSQVAAGFGNAAQTKGILRDYGFRSAAYRTYRTADGNAEVTSRLLRLGNAHKAGWFVQGMSMRGTAFSVPGVAGARGFLIKPKEEGGTGTLVGLLHQGDVEVEITVEVKGTPRTSLLTDLVRRQQARLRTGR